MVPRLFSFCRRALLLAGLMASPAAGEPSLERGAYLVEGPAACGNCHSPQDMNGPIAGLEYGGMLVERNDLFTAVAPNISPGGRVAQWTDVEFVRAIREGIRPDGSVIGPPMPIRLYRGLSDDDVQSIVLYLRSVPAVENDPGQSVYGMPIPPAYGPPVNSVPSVPEGVTVEYGAYLAGPVAHCIECHSPMGPQGPMIDTHAGQGGMEFHGPWGVSVAPPITGAALTGYSDEEMAAMIRQGIRPDGSRMMPPMPYRWLARMTDADLAAILLYLRSLPPA
ncbi:Cytochrome c [Rubellimicrobium thermophilum DSM 16684]|uniref:Cytochrome c n=1 Tax=Rubellimicrobium thermophilum DSM 16684 TaxID=1123069 RepID=S9R0Q4_9RHOB|nr:c-type cytochrome [Rubellimicrobium thermophilum]EPX87211.1 Cytochrome c [Rubellimicrobium thermophilum DSM 16684]